MDLLDMMKERRSIRKYTTKKVERKDLEKIAEAGIYAPSPGGRQSTKIVFLEDANLINEIGVINANCENRNWQGASVSSEQPSIIDDLTIRSGFYGCQALAMVCIEKDKKTMVNPIGGAFACAQNIVLEAFNLGISSCIVGRGEATYNHEVFQNLWKKWGMDENYLPVVFVCLGYIDGAYPKVKERKENRVLFIG